MVGAFVGGTEEVGVLNLAAGGAAAGRLLDGFGGAACATSGEVGLESPSLSLNRELGGGRSTGGGLRNSKEDLNSSLRDDGIKPYRTG